MLVNVGKRNSVCSFAMYCKGEISLRYVNKHDKVVHQSSSQDMLNFLKIILPVKVIIGQLPIYETLDILSLWLH